MTSVLSPSLAMFPVSLFQPIVSLRDIRHNVRSFLQEHDLTGALVAYRIWKYQKSVRDQCNPQTEIRSYFGKSVNFEIQQSDFGLWTASTHHRPSFCSSVEY